MHSFAWLLAVCLILPFCEGCGNEVIFPIELIASERSIVFGLDTFAAFSFAAIASLVCLLAIHSGKPAIFETSDRILWYGFLLLIVANFAGAITDHLLRWMLIWITPTLVLGFLWTVLFNRDDPLIDRWSRRLGYYSLSALSFTCFLGLSSIRLRIGFWITTIAIVVFCISVQWAKSAIASKLSIKEPQLKRFQLSLHHFLGAMVASFCLLSYYYFLFAWLNPKPDPIDPIDSKSQQTNPD